MSASAENRVKSIRVQLHMRTWCKQRHYGDTVLTPQTRCSHSLHDRGLLRPVRNRDAKWPICCRNDAPPTETRPTYRRGATKRQQRRRSLISSHLATRRRIIWETWLITIMFKRSLGFRMRRAFSDRWRHTSVLTPCGRNSFSPVLALSIFPAFNILPVRIGYCYTVVDMQQEASRVAKKKISKTRSVACICPQFKCSLFESIFVWGRVKLRVNYSEQSK